MEEFRIDLMAEQELARFLDEFLYPHLGLDHISRPKDMKSQFQGIDIELGDNKKVIYVDEKGLLSVPKPIPTFALELSYLNKHAERKTGWLYGDGKLTTHYLLCWVKRNNVTLADFVMGDIHYVEAMLVNRISPHVYLEERYGIDKGKADTEVAGILKARQGGSLHSLGEGSKSRYHFSQNLNEQPVNIVMSKKELLANKVVCKHYIVKRSKLLDCLEMNKE